MSNCFKKEDNDAGRFGLALVPVGGADVGVMCFSAIVALILCSSASSLRSG